MSAAASEMVTPASTRSDTKLYATRIRQCTQTAYVSLRVLDWVCGRCYPARKSTMGLSRTALA